MSILVYAISGSPSAWRVLLALTFKKLNYEVKYLNLSNQEQKSEAYLEINPRGTVPTLVTNGITLRDSVAILAWLDQAYPEEPLFGRNLDDSSNIWQTTMEACEHLRNANKELLVPIFFQRANDKTDYLTIASKNLRLEMTRFESSLNARDYFGGYSPCAADACCFPEVRLLKRAIETKASLMTSLGFDINLSDFPNLAAWLERVESFGDVKKTMPPHWS